MKFSYKNLFNGVYLLLILCVITVALLRVLGNSSWHVPIDILTSGYEEESIFAIWKYINGQPVYKDPHTIPFAASYFNWLFYYSYGFVIDILQKLFHFADAWIPQVGRYLTFLGSIVGAILSVKIIQNITGNKQVSVFQLSLVIGYFFGFFVGFWMFTIRPDVWALTLEVAGLALFIQYTKREKIALLIISAILFYMAFSFKHSFVGVAFGCGLFLLFRKKVGLAVLFGLIPIGLVALTLLVGSDDYQYLLLKSQLDQHLGFAKSVENFRLAFVKALLVTMTGFFVLAFVLVRYPLKKIFRNILGDDTALVLTLTGLSSFCLFYIAAMKPGSSDNYFFSPFAILVFVIVYAVHKIQSGKNRAIIYSVYALVSVVYVGLGVLIITGKQGVVNLASMSGRYRFIKEVAAKYDQPSCVEKDNYANLPWITPNKYNFVLATTYYILKTEPDELEEGGIEGLMDKGYFNTIIDVDVNVPEHKELYYIADTAKGNDVTLYIWRKKAGLH